MKNSLLWVMLLFAAAFITGIHIKRPVREIQCVNKQDSIQHARDSIKELVLLTKLIQSESGSESFIDKLLVGSVVLNWMRIENTTMENVVYYPNRFSGVYGKGFRETCESKEAAILLLTYGSIDTSVKFFLNPEIASNHGWKRKVMQRELIARTSNHFFYK